MAKEELVEIAVDLGLGYPSQLSRWSEKKLEEEIKKAEENGVQKEEEKEELVWIERMGDACQKPISELQAHLDVGWRLVK